MGNDSVGVRSVVERMCQAGHSKYFYEKKVIEEILLWDPNVRDVLGNMSVDELKVIDKYLQHAFGIYAGLRSDTSRIAASLAAGARILANNNLESIIVGCYTARHQNIPPIT